MISDPEKTSERGPQTPAEQSLQASELSYRRLFEAAQDGILILEYATGRITDANPFLVRLLGFSLAEMFGHTVGEMSPFRDIVSNQAMLERLQKDGYVRYEDLPLKTRDGRNIAVEFVSNVYEAGGQKVIQCNIRDITIRKHAEQQLNLLYTCVSHLNEMVVITEVGPVAGTRPAIVFVNAAFEQCLDNMTTATQRAADLVNQILTFSRQKKAAREPIQLNHTVLEALKLLRASLPASIRIQTELTDTPAVLANATAIHQVIMNLGTNAWHAMRPHSGVLKVDMKTMEADADFIRLHPDLRPGRYVLLSVSDSGCGMDRATQERVFDPFFTTKAVGEGTGFGLAVVHGIMRSHEGAVNVYSRPGEGTTFQLYFPALAAEPEILEKESTPIPRGEAQHILYLDDEKPLALLGRLMLERLGYLVTVTTSPLEAIAAVRDHPGRFDLVITDLTMPVMDGTSLGRQLLLLQPRLKMILTTGYSGLLTTEKVREMGFLELLAKPVNARALGEVVDKVMRQTTIPAVM